MIKKPAAIAGALAVITIVGLLAAGTIFAQTSTPPTQTMPAPFMPFLGRGFGERGGSWAQFDAMAAALNLTPTQLFEQLHSGKTLSEIAQAQGVDLQKLQETANASRIQAMKDAIAQAVKDGKMTQEQADWLLQGMDKGYIPGGRSFGPMRGGMRGFRGQAPSRAPAASAPGTSF